MSSAAKALALLDHFQPARPEIGLSQLCRLAGRDKATTYRYLQSLETAGLVEQNPITKHYRLGPKLLQLARTREETVPRSAGVEMALRALAERTGETAHAAILSGHALYRLAAVESPSHSIRVVIDVEVFPLHATASGLCALAFGPETLFEAACRRADRFTDSTVTDPEALRAQVALCRASGFGRAAGSFEAEVNSLAAPLYDQTGQFAGTVSTASVASRFSGTLERGIKAHLVIAAREITRNWGGVTPDNVEAAWAASLAGAQELETMP